MAHPKHPGAFVNLALVFSGFGGDTKQLVVGELALFTVLAPD